MDLNCGVTSIGAQCIATLFNKVLTAVCYEGGQNDSAHSKSSFEAGVELSANLSGRAGLRSAKRGDLAVPRTATELGRRSFSVAAPVIAHVDTANATPHMAHT